MSAKAGALGFSSPDLMYMRMLMGQQQIPQMSIGPVNDLGSGITAAGQQILNALITRRNMAQQNQIIQAMMAQAQAQQEAAQAAAQQQVESTYSALVSSGVPEQMARAAAMSGDASTVNNVLTYGQKQLEIQRAAEGMVRQGTLVQVDKNGQPVVDADGNLVTRQLISPQEALSALSTPGEAGQRAINSLLYKAEAMKNGIDVNTAEGQNAFKVRFGFDPKNLVGIQKDRAESLSAVTNAANNLMLMPFTVPKAQADLNQTIANTNSINLGAEQKSIENQYLPQYLQQRNEGSVLENQGKTISNQQNAFKFGNDVKALNLVESAAKAGTLGNPVSNVNNAALYGAYTGDGNAFKTVNDMTNNLVNPKAGTSPLEGMTSIGQQMRSLLTPPQAAQPQMPEQRVLTPQEQGQLLQMNFQNALKAPSRMLNRTQLDIINQADYLKGLYEGFMGQ